MVPGGFEVEVTSHFPFAETVPPKWMEAIERRST